MELIKDQQPSWDKFVIDIQEDGFLAIAVPWQENAPPHQTREPVYRDVYILASTLHAVYQDYCKSHGVKAGNASHLGTALRKIESIESVRVTVAGLQTRCWKGIPLRPADATILPFTKPQAPDAEPQKKVDNVEL